MKMSSGRVGRAIALVAACLVTIAAGGALYWYWAQGPDTGGTARRPGRAPVPVSVAVVAARDVPIFLTGLGAVQASYTVAIHSQVDGKLQDVLFTEGQEVKKGDILAKIDPRLFQAALLQAQAKRAQNAALLVAAEKDLIRSKALTLRDFGTQQNLDQQQARVDQLKASIEADEASIETAKTQLDYATIIAPSDGRIGVRAVDPGNIVRASDARSIALLVRTRPSAVLFTLSAHHLDDVRDALTLGPVEVTAFDQENRRKLSTGELLLIDNVIDQTTSTIRLKAMFANDDERLWPGEFVNARVQVETRRNVLAVPSSAVQRGPQGLFAWVVTANNTAVTRPIAVGPATGDMTIVTSGIAEGDRVVIDGHYKLQVNAPVTITLPQSASAK